jgi:Domain of unknown function (DUF397)
MAASEGESTLAWRKSTFSGADSCVVIAPLSGGGAAVTDSKRPDRPVLYFDDHEWTAFLAGVRNGEFDFA